MKCFTKAIEECFREPIKERKVHNYLFVKIALTACASIVITTGIVYATTKIYEKIWKAPDKVINPSNIENINEKSINIISEFEAIEKANNLLEKFGYANEQIKSIELISNFYEDELLWQIKTNKNISILVDATGGKSFNISIDSTLNKDIEKYRTTKEQAEKTARALSKKYGYDLEEYNCVEIDSNKVLESEAYIWYVNFYKKYGDVINPYESVKIGFIPGINEIYYFIVKDEKFENNSIEVAEQEAKEIALKEEQRINTKYKIKNINITIDIVPMNGIAYLRTNDYEQFCEQATEGYPWEKWIAYHTERHIRKAWIVTIDYDVANSINEPYDKNDKQFSYYIDITTGEVIGGSSIYKMTKD